MRVPPVPDNKLQTSSWGFGWGFATGATLVLVALLSTPATPTDQAAAQGLTAWLSTNLGHSVWFFAVVCVLFVVKLMKLKALLSQQRVPIEQSREVAALEQMLDVWTQVFIGIGVIWTAVGMRSALQFALGEPGAVLAEDASSVLRKLVDGGILLALSTTIVGAVGGYVMRLIKTIVLGAALQSFYETLERQDISALLKATERIEHHLGQLKPSDDNVTQLPGRAL